MQILVVGNANVDLIMGPVSPWPKTGTEVLIETYQLRVGGALGNMALALHALRTPSLYAANVGDDPLGQWLHEELAQHGCMLVVTPGPTAVTVGLSHPDGERTFVSHLGHLAAFDARMATQILEKLHVGDMLVICGYFLLPALREHAVEICRLAHEQGVKVLLDTGWPPEGWTTETRREIETLLDICDFFLPNQEELAGLTGESELKRGLKRCPATLFTVAKLGEEGAAYLDGSNVERVAAPEVSVIDTVGAGDTFNAAFVYALRLGVSRKQAVGMAVRAASAAIASNPRTYPAPEIVVE